MSAPRLFNNESTRLSALLIGLFAASALLLGITIYWKTDRAMLAELRDSIDADAGAIVSGYRSEGRAEAIEVVQQLTAVPGLSGRYLLQSRDGHKLAGNLDAMAAIAGLFEVASQDRSRGGAERRPVFGEGRFLPDGTYLFVGEDTHRLRAFRERVLGSIGWIVGATLLLATAGGALLSVGFLRRMDAITRTCRAIVAGQFSERIPVGSSHTQLDLLATTINDMLDRIAALLESLRQMSSDIAHDLRTPLTRLRQRLESTRTRATSVADYEPVVERALKDCDATLAVFSALLRISEIESGVRLTNFAAVPLSDLLHQVAELYAPVAEDGQQLLLSDLSGDITVHADATLMLQMFSNLVENAIRHAGRGATIRLECHGAGSEAIVRVIDSGPGIPPSERDKVFGRLYRLERSRNMPGNGLGLALVAAIAKLHQYAIELSDAQPGLCVTLRIPLSQSERDPTKAEGGVTASGLQTKLARITTAPSA
jgi:signal transduction histidine kinase